MTQQPFPTPSAQLGSELVARLECLERSNRRHRLAALAAGLACLAWTACALGPEKQSLSAERFVLLSPDGGEAAVLEVDSNGHPFLLMKSGEASTYLTTRGPSLLLRGPDGKVGAFLGVDSKATSRLELVSARLIDGVRLTAHADGSAGVYVLDPQGRERGALESLSTGLTSLQLRDGQRRIRGQLGLDAASVPSVLLLDEAGGRRLGMVVGTDGNPLLELQDGKAHARARLATLFDGSPRLELLREDGAPSFTAP